MGSSTPKGYPYPVGTDLVMDGDNAMQALAEAVDSTALITRATTVGQSLVAGTGTVNWVSWNAAVINECALTKTSAHLWTVTLPGIYVVSAVAFTTGFQTATAPSRSFMQLHVTDAAGGSGVMTDRSGFEGENTTGMTTMADLKPGATIALTVQPHGGTSVAANTGILTVARLGRTVA